LNNAHIFERWYHLVEWKAYAESLKDLEAALNPISEAQETIAAQRKIADKK
jgi:hypothetical protein